MIVVGFDPGAVHTGWAALDCDHIMPVYVDGGVVRGVPPFTDQEWWRFSPADLVAVETVSGYAHGERAHAKTKDLILASQHAGIILGVLGGRGFPTMEVPAPKWRKALVGNASASDLEIRTMVVGRVRKLPKKHNAHVRDAIGVALYAADTKRLLLRRQPAPQPVGGEPFFTEERMRRLLGTEVQ